MQRRPCVWASEIGIRIWTLWGIDFLKIFFLEVRSLYLSFSLNMSFILSILWMIDTRDLLQLNLSSSSSFLLQHFFLWFHHNGWLPSELLTYLLCFPYFGSALCLGFPTFNLTCGSPKHPLPQMPYPRGVFFRSFIWKLSFPPLRGFIMFWVRGKEFVSLVYFPWYITCSLKSYTLYISVSLVHNR